MLSLKSIRPETGSGAGIFLIFFAMTMFGPVGIAGESGDFAKKLEEVLPDLASVDAGVKGRAGCALEKMCLSAGRPGAEDERPAAARALAAKLGPGVPAEARVRLVRQLQFIGRDESVPALAELLKEGQPAFLWEAAR